MRIFTDEYLQVRYINLKNKKVKKDLKLLAIGDVHISDLVSLKKLEIIKKRILEEQADYIVYAGDLIDRAEEINNKFSLSKLKDLLDFSSKIAKTFVVLGNHDYIHRVNYNSYINEISEVIRSIVGVRLLNNEVYKDNDILIMGYLETKEYYSDANYNFEAFYNDFLRHTELYKDTDVYLPTIALTHSPEFSNDNKCLSLFKDYDLIICGHTHDGCVPFGIGNFNWGIIDPKKKFFPKNIRGLRKIGNNYILVTGGIVKISKCAPKLLHPFNHLCPMQMDVITLSQKVDNNIKKKWY